MDQDAELELTVDEVDALRRKLIVKAETEGGD